MFEQRPRSLFHATVHKSKEPLWTLAPPRAINDISVFGGDFFPRDSEFAYKRFY